MKKVRVTTTLCSGIKDNQAQAVHHTLKNTFDCNTITSMRMGKIFDIEIDDNVTDDQINEIAKAVSNPIMDDVKIEILND